jgi:HlyD family secretion protein
VQRAEAALTTAVEQEEIQKSQNSANLQEAEVNFELAKVDLREYTEGTYPQEIQEAKNNLDMANITLKNREEDLVQSRNLFQKGFVTAAEVKTAEYDVIWARNDVTKQETKLKVLQEYTYQKNMTDKNNKVAQAEKRLARVKRENASNLAQKVADVVAKRQGLELQKYRLSKSQEQMEKCVIRSPADGMVVYPVENFNRGGGQNPLQEGSKVGEQQLLLRLPDTRAMKAVIRINEGQVSKLRMDPENPMRATVKVVGFPDPIGATVTKISVMADGNQRWWNPDLKEYPVDLTLDETPATMKPGMTVQAQIFISRLENVLAVPLNALYASGKDTYVFVRGSQGPQPKSVRIGPTNETHAQILDGVTAGQEVLLLQTGQGSALLEKAGIKTGPTSQPSNTEPETPEAPEATASAK